MAEALEELLDACAQASRGIRLLTAEASRRATLLRLCFSDYEAALERLETLKELRQRRQAADNQMRNSAATECPSTTSDMERFISISAPLRGHTYRSPRETLDLSHGSCSYDVCRDPEYDRIDGNSDQHKYRADDAERGSILDSYRITESLRQILEQARSIRRQEPSISTPRIGATASPATSTARSQSEDRPLGTIDICRNNRTKSQAIGAVIKKEGSGTSAKKKSGHSYRGFTRPTAATLARRRSKEALPSLSQHASDGRPSSAASPTPRRIDSSPKRANSSSTQSHASNSTFYSITALTEGQTSVTLAARGVPANSKPKMIGGPMQISSSKSGGSTNATRPNSASCQRKRADGLLDTGVPRTVDSNRGGTAACNAHAPALDLPQGMREELMSYSLARNRLLGRRKKDAGGEGTRDVAGAAGKTISWMEQEREGGDEARLLAVLNVDPVAESFDSMQQQHGYRSRGLGMQDRPIDGQRNEFIGESSALSRQAQAPDPRFAAWDKLLRRDAYPLSTAGESRVLARGGETWAHTAKDKPSIEKNDRDMRARMEARVECGEVECLQQSLLMMLDEVEGSRAVLAVENSSRPYEGREEEGGGRRDQSTRWISSDEDGDGDPAAIEGDAALLREFEDWYAWNKVADIAQLLRQYMDVHDDGAPLSEEAAAIIADPRSTIGSENPLQAPVVLSRRQGLGSEWREAWKESAEAKGLEGTMCFKLVSGLQDDGALSCNPLDEYWSDGDTRPLKPPSQDAPASCNPNATPEGYERTSDRAIGKTAFPRKFRTTALLAAEHDVSKMVAPPLARALSRACRTASKSTTIHSQADSPASSCAKDCDAHGGTCDRSKIKSHPLERFREKVVSASHHDKGGSGTIECVGEADRVWAPALAVYRAVDAVLGGGGRPRISFVRRKTEGSDSGQR